MWSGASHFPTDLSRNRESEVGEPGLHFHQLGGRRTRLEERGEGLRKELSAEGLQAPAFHGESLLRAVSRELSERKPNFRYLRRD